MKDRALALAGMVQSIELVLQVANDGRGDEQVLETALDSVFRLESDSTIAVYGSVDGVRRGLQCLRAMIDGSGTANPAIGKIAFTVLQVERRLARSPDLLRTIGDGITDISRQREHFSSTHPAVINRLGELYSQTISRLTPRVLVQGNPAQLSQTAVVSQIRAVLLAAIRSAVLWRQNGGSWWDLLLRRRQIAEAAAELLKS
jgi:high frequency lysogenization protein